MSVFFTDTDCELWYTDVDKYDIKLLEMPYIIDNEEKFYDMGRNTNFKELYDKMRAGAMPMTAALNPDDYIRYFEPVMKAGEDILYVHFSDKLSGTFNYMQTALDELKQKYPERKVTLFNTKSICYGAGLQVLEAVKLHASGKSDEEVVEFLTKFSPKVATEFVVESLSHLKRGGRLSTASAVIGGILKIKPIIRVMEDGTLNKFTTVKGMKKAVCTMVENLKNTIDLNSGLPVTILDADNAELSDFAERQITEAFAGKVSVQKYPIGPVIGAHCGPGTLGLVYVKK